MKKPVASQPNDGGMPEAKKGFNLSDSRKIQPDQWHETNLSGTDLDMLKSQMRLIYAATWGLDPGYVVIS